MFGILRKTSAHFPRRTVSMIPGRIAINWQHPIARGLLAVVVNPFVSGGCASRIGSGMLTPSASHVQGHGSSGTFSMRFRGYNHLMDLLEATIAIQEYAQSSTTQHMGGGAIKFFASGSDRQDMGTQWRNTGALRGFMKKDAGTAILVINSSPTVPYSEHVTGLFDNTPQANFFEGAVDKGSPAGEDSQTVDSRKTIVASQHNATDSFVGATYFILWNRRLADQDVVDYIVRGKFWHQVVRIEPGMQKWIWPPPDVAAGTTNPFSIGAVNLLQGKLGAA